MAVGNHHHAAPTTCPSSRIIGNEDSDNLDAVIARGVERGELRADTEVSDLRAAVFGTLFATLIEWLSEPDGPSPTDLEHRLLRRTMALWSISAGCS
jgi:hypothetical protein